MIFNSLAFAVYIVLLWTAYWRVLRSTKSRSYLLLVGSFIFYSWWDIQFLALLLTSISIAWAGVRLMGSASCSAKASRHIMAVTIALELGLLGLFKYYGFFVESFIKLVSLFGVSAEWDVLQIVLPVGVSFFVFQAISYVVDAYRAEVDPRTSWGSVALYIAFFPQLVAGPIVRARDFLPQLTAPKRFDSAEFMEGIRITLIGAVYKVVFADNLAAYVDPIFAGLERASSAAVRSAAMGYYAQIYFDFAGYSLMAIGVAKTLGYRLPKNFDHPYRAASCTEFWRRWHISLSTWLRDYLYIPLGGNRGSRFAWARNLMLTMTLGGLWHGASWNFVLWGIIHGLALIIHKVWTSSPIPDLVPRAGRWMFGLILTQCVIFFAWIPFRAATTHDTKLVLWKFFSDAAGTIESVPLVLIALPLLVDSLLVAGGRARLFLRPGVVQILYAFILLMCVWLAYTKVDAFIYFQF